MEENEEDRTNQNKSMNNNSCLVSIINEIVDCALCQVAFPSTSSSPGENNSSQTPPIEQRLFVSQPEITTIDYNQPATPLGQCRPNNNPNISKSLSQIPPSYSTVIKFSPLATNNGNRINIQPSYSFISRQPPPSYQEVHGIFLDSLSRETTSSSSSDMSLGPTPVYVLCPRCSAIVVTRTRNIRTKTTYFASLLLCLCLCWPCCLLPFWMKTCQDTEHSCPQCSYYFGTHTAF